MSVRNAQKNFLYNSANSSFDELYNFSGNLEFTTCGATGPFGPTLANALSTYAARPFVSEWLNDGFRFNVSGGVQYWKVPKKGNYTIRCAGSRSGASTFGGLGRDLTTTFFLEPGESLKIFCGQRGTSNNSNIAGAGGASFVAVHRIGDWQPIVVSGGGAGISANSPQSTNNNRNGFDPNVRSNETGGGAGSWYDTSYSGQIGHFWPGGGGGGWGYKGADGTINFYASNQPLGGSSLSSSSPIGGRWTTGQNTYNGGFGGGGATGINGGSAGGGGGYWGGNATFSLLGSSSDDTTHLGGGSFSKNSYTVNGTNNGEGFVTISL